MTETGPGACVVRGVKSSGWLVVGLNFVFLEIL